MSEEPTAGATGTGLQSANRGLLWLMVVLCTPVPFGIYVTLVEANSSSITSSLTGLIWTVVISVIATWLTLRTGQTAMLYVSGVIGVVFVEMLWLAVGQMSDVAYIFPVLVAAVLYRCLRICHAVSLTEENRSSFVFEGIGSLVAVLLVIATAGPRWSLAILLLLSLFGRMYAMWGIERSQTQTRGGSHSVMIIIAIAAFLVLLGPKIVQYIALAVGIGGGILSLPLLYLLNAIIPGSVGRRYTQMMQKMGKHAQKMNPHGVPAQGTAHHWIWLTLYGLIVIGALVGFWIFLRKRTLGEHSRADKDAVEVQRSWIQRTRRLNLLHTDNPVRKQYQAFLVERHEQGETIAPDETVREYENRIEDGDSGERVDGARRLRRLYERVRYGRRTGE